MRRSMIRGTLMAAALGLLGSVTTAGASAATNDRFVRVTAANSPFGKRNTAYSFMSEANQKLVSAELNWDGGDYGALRARATDLGPWEGFSLEVQGNSTWTIKSLANGKFVSAELNYVGGTYGLLRARADVAAEWEKFDLYYNEARKLFTLKSQANGKFVSAELNYGGDAYGILRARATNVGPWEWFRMWGF